jgi:DNA segregation ATPase FtsK/SpoIIIE, S-DNA-T family
MPQLLSRMDHAGWLTPSVADILDQGSPPPGGEESIRAQAMELQRALAEQTLPIRIANVRPTSSRTLFIARSDIGSRLGKIQTLQPSDINRAFAQLTKSHPDWSLGYLPQFEDTDAIGVLLRSPQHQPLRLRQMLVRTAYREDPSNLALLLGVTLQQQLVVRDLAEFDHMIVVGGDVARRHYLWTQMLTLVVLNTPSEMRLAVAGGEAATYSGLTEMPHMLGRILSAPKDAQRLLDGLVKEVQRRQQWFREKNVGDVVGYNAALSGNNGAQLPRIVLLIDSLSDPAWQSAADQWTPSLYDLLMNGGTAGIHLMLTASPEAFSAVPSLLKSTLPVQVFLQSPGANLRSHLQDLPMSTMQFVDAVLIEQEKESRVTAMEIGTISEQEIQRAAAYWRQATNQRVQPAPPALSVARTGVTGLLPLVDSAERYKDEETAAVVAAQPKLETPEKAAQPVPASVENKTVLLRAQALAAYLGWLGVGPLQDVLGLSLTEAQGILAELCAKGVLEAGSSSVLRFARLADNPLERDMR